MYVSSLLSQNLQIGSDQPNTFYLVATELLCSSAHHLRKLHVLLNLCHVSCCNVTGVVMKGAGDLAYFEISQPNALTLVLIRAISDQSKIQGSISAVTVAAQEGDRHPNAD